jgi:hypothetical protein
MVFSRGEGCVRAGLVALLQNERAVGGSFWEIPRLVDTAVEQGRRDSLKTDEGEEGDGG